MKPAQPTLVTASVWPALLALLLIAGCMMPPDLVFRPDIGPAPDSFRDDSRVAETPVDSVLLQQAAADPEAQEVTLLENGDDALLARIHLIRSARESIDIQTFIWVYDDTGKWMFKELLAAARRGVRVRLLIDQFVPPGVSTSEYAAIATAHRNLEIRLFRPLSSNAINTEWTYLRKSFTRFTTMNRRMHNKVFIVDDTVAIIGGRNVQNAYFDRDPELCFRDRDIIVTGPVTRSAAGFFEVFWNDRDVVEASRMSDLHAALTSGKVALPDAFSLPPPATFRELDQLANAADLSAVRPALYPVPVRKMTFLSDVPADIRGRFPGRMTKAFDPLKKVLIQSREEVLIQTPYPVLGKKSKRLARKIRQNSPDARIRVSTNSLSSSDHAVVSGIAVKQRREQIQELRLEIHIAKPVPGDIRRMVPRYDALLTQPETLDDPDWAADPEILPIENPGPRFCVHAKSVVMDRKASFVGSHNFDPRSFNLNSECGILIEDEAFSARLGDVIEESLHPRNSWVLAERRFPPVMQEINALIAAVSGKLPMFDIWPLEHVSAYELHDEGNILSPYDPGFHENYTDVGVFPGLNLGTKEVQVQLIRAFGGLSSPLM